MSELDLTELRRIAEEMSKAPIGAAGTRRGSQSFAFYGMDLGGLFADEVATELPEKIIALLDRIETLEAEVSSQTAYAKNATDGQANLMRQHREQRARAERAEARLARVTDDSMAERIKEAIHDAYVTTPALGNVPWLNQRQAEANVIAAIRAVAADEQEADQ